MDILFVLEILRVILLPSTLWLKSIKIFITCFSFLQSWAKIENWLSLKFSFYFPSSAPYSASPPSHRERCCWSTSCRRVCLPCTSSQHGSYGGKYQTEKYRKQFPIISPTLSTFSESLCTLDTLRLNLSLVDAFSSEICSCRVKKKLFIYNIISTCSVANLLAQTRLNSPRWAFCSKCPPFW